MDTSDMDMDIDIDLGPVDIPEAAHSTDYPRAPTAEAMDQTNTTEHVEGTLATHKVHIRGVDDITTADLRAFAVEHYSTHVPIRIDWIDDTSANLVYTTPAAAIEALNCFSSQPLDRNAASTQLLHLRSAKVMSNHPETRLLVRMALSTDVKKAKAYEASRFYMMHPEHDPREKIRRSKDGDGRHDYRKRHYNGIGDRERRIDARERNHDANVYDDDDSRGMKGGRFATSRRSSISMRSNDSSAVDIHSDRGSHYRAAHRGDFYRPGSRWERKSSRNRSASPGLGDVSLPTSRKRQRTPSANQGKELLPVRSDTKKVISSTKELFPNKSAAADLKKELFPTRIGSVQHRRSDAFDAADETAELFATGMALSLGNHLARTASTAVDMSYGRLRSSDPEPQYDPHELRVDTGVDIRGASKRQDIGVSILGAAQKSHVGTIRELFPNSKANNEGKELFAERLQGRSLKRNKAEDLFY